MLRSLLVCLDRQANSLSLSLSLMKDVYAHLHKSHAIADHSTSLFTPSYHS